MDFLIIKPLRSEFNFENIKLFHWAIYHVDEKAEEGHEKD